MKSFNQVKQKDERDSRKKKEKENQKKKSIYKNNKKKFQLELANYLIRKVF